MDVKKVIQQLMIERGLDINTFSEKLNMKPQSLRNKLNRNAFSVSDLLEMLEILDCDLQVVTRDTNKIFN